MEKRRYRIRLGNKEIGDLGNARIDEARGFDL